MIIKKRLVYIMGLKLQYVNGSGNISPIVNSTSRLTSNLRDLLSSCACEYYIVVLLLCIGYACSPIVVYSLLACCLAYWDILPNGVLIVIRFFWPFPK